MIMEGTMVIVRTFLEKASEGEGLEWPGFNFRPWRSILKDFPWLITLCHATRLESAWQEIARSPLNGTTQPVDIEDEGRSSTTDRR